MTTIQRVAQIFGVIFILIAILGFVAAGTSMEADPEMADKVLGLFPVNLLHNIVHLLFGIWGLAASRSSNAAVGYARTGGIIYLVLAVLGYISPDGFGFVPLGGHDIWLHVLLGAALAAAGFTRSSAARRTPE